MEGIERATSRSSSRASGSKRAFVYAAVAVNSRFDTEFSAENVENHYRTLKSRYTEIKKVRDLSGAGWDDATKTITLDPMVALTYVEHVLYANLFLAHPAAKPFINKPIDHYEALRVICGDDNATGVYATSMFADLGDNNLENEGNNMQNFDEVPIQQPSDDDADANSAPPVLSSPASSSTPRSQRSSRGSKNPSMMGDLIVVVREMASAIKNPTNWTESLYAKVMEMDGFEKKELIQVFDFLQFREIEARGFIAKDIDLRKDWIEGFLSRMG
ncbi:Myb/SANT-like domain-containing protein [Dioscorea alata]|uniref:Myb/SANT-like domain-containing protein n=1 Tax=Dioscorea alata TaxID=55571 RepID=A0ACB7V6I4_DIOAL|nr:Myb/SANT-like domain-containing protein [Dioscorea alata]